jgi:heme/copper-type cytochrome/quinol oxidase subunit 2
VDCILGRMNKVGVRLVREGVYYGQCSELCGVGHSAMTDSGERGEDVGQRRDK